MPIKIEFEANGKKIRDENVKPRIVAALKQVAIEAVQLLKIEKTVPIDQSVLKGSFVHKVNELALTSLAGSPVAYADVQDKGRRAGKRLPPKKPLVDWILRKGIAKKHAKSLIENAKEAGKKLPRGFRANLFAGTGRGALAAKLRKLNASKKTKAGALKASKELDSLAYVIRRSISRDGIKGHRFYLKIARKMRPRFKKLQADAIAG